jgi:hypothetical protein
MTTQNNYSYNRSGAFGFARIDPSDLADIGRWEIHTENSVPEFCHSGSNGFNVTVKGKCRGDCNLEQILNTEDEIYYRFQDGDLTTLKLFETTSLSRMYLMVARVKSIDEAVEIDNATEIRIPCALTIHGGWQFPGGQLQTGGENPTGNPNYNGNTPGTTMQAPINITWQA